MIWHALRLCIGVLVLLLGHGAPALADKRVALLIGISAYETLAPLKTPAGNVGALEQAFTKAGFDKVVTGLDLKHDDLIRKLRAFEEEAEDADIAVLYFSGRGVEHGNDSYIVPTDARLASEQDVEDEAVAVDRLLRAVEGAKTLKLLILDTSRDNRMDAATRNRPSCCILPLVEPPFTDTLILYATKTGRAATEGDGPVDPYTRALVSHLFEPGLDLRLATGKVRDDVIAATQGRQEPFAYGSLSGGNMVLAK